MVGMKTKIFTLFIMISFLITWFIITTFKYVPNFLLPSPHETAISIYKILTEGSEVPDFYFHLRVTVYEFTVAFTLATITGVAIGLILAEMKFLGNIFEPLATAFYAIPTVLIYPIIFLIFGVEESSKIVFGFIVGVFPVIANTIAGFRQLDRNLIVIATAMGATKLTLYTKVIIPAALYTILAGIRQCSALSMIGVLAAELIASPRGIGYLLGYCINRFMVTELYGLIFITISLVWFINYLFNRLENYYKR